MRNVLLGLREFAISRGCIGVKMSMVFAPYGNAGLQRLRPKFWHRTWLPAFDLIKALRKLFEATNGSLLVNRLMYGSDWEMLTIEGAASENYLTIFERIFSALDCDPTLRIQGNLSANFFGINAVNYLLLRRGSATRRRLDWFYFTRGIERPQWVPKVDRLRPMVT